MCTHISVTAHLLRAVILFVKMKMIDIIYSVVSLCSNSKSDWSCHVEVLTKRWKSKTKKSKKVTLLRQRGLFKCVFCIVNMTVCVYVCWLHLIYPVATTAFIPLVRCHGEYAIQCCFIFSKTSQHHKDMDLFILCDCM